MRLQELPGTFEKQWETVFEKSRLGLQDLGDLAALLSLFPESFHVDSSNPSGPTVVCQPDAGLVCMPNEETLYMLWQRSRDLQPKRVDGTLSRYAENRERIMTDVADKKRAAIEAIEQEKAKEAAKRAYAEATAAAAPKAMPRANINMDPQNSAPPWRAGQPQDMQDPNFANVGGDPNFANVGGVPPQHMPWMQTSSR